MSDRKDPEAIVREIKVVDKLYGVAGPAGWVEPYIEGTASTHILQDYCLDVDVGCDVGCGIDGLDMLGLPDDLVQFDFPLVNMSIYHNCWPWY